ASDLPVDLLEDILLRLDDAADLVRASAACASFRGIISNRRFRRRFRSLHRRPVLGFLGYRMGGRLKFYPAEPPRRSAPAARALARATNFSFSFLAEPAMAWRVSDFRDGRVLLSRFAFDKFVVYDPLHRQHVQILPIASDDPMYQRFQPFLLPGSPTADGDGEDHPSSFQVMCNNLLSEDAEYAVRTFIYSMATKKWSLAATLGSPVSWVYFSRRHYARGCFCWVRHGERAMLVLDTREVMKFSVVNLPPGSEHQQKQKACADDYDWRHDNGIPLFLGYEYWSLDGVAEAEGYALLRGVPRDEHRQQVSGEEKAMPIARYFTVEVKTLLVEQLCVLEISSRPEF
ncbi:hypothetical protein BS78_08G140900, partial [Paspalum vaginatum]